jgi:5-methylcytosine-specific restriction endonuclease McrA
MRKVPEWIGKTDDAKIPDRVRARVFLTHKGICHISRRPIRAADDWDCDHVIALVNGGQHRESNLAPALKAPHKSKTAADVRIKAKIARIRNRHLGIKKPRTITGWRRMNGTAVHAGRDR